MGDNRGTRMTRKWPLSVAVWVLLLGVYSAINGAVAMKNWAAYADGTRLYYGISLGAGVVAAAAGAWLLLGRDFGARAGWAAPAAIGVLAVNQIVGLLLNTILCFTPG